MSPELKTIDDLVTDAFQWLSCLSAMLDEAEDMDQFVKLFSAFFRCIPPLCNLLRTQQFLSDDSADELTSALSQAIDEVWEELGIQL